MAVHKLPILETIASAWRKVYGTKSTYFVATALSLTILLALTVVMAFGYGVLQLYSAKTIDEHHLLSIENIISYIISTYFVFGFMYMGIKRAYDLRISYFQIFDVFRFNVILKLFKTFLLSVSFLLILATLEYMGEISLNLIGITTHDTILKIVISLMQLMSIIVMIYLSVRLILSFAFVLDKNVDPLDAVKLSFQATRQNVLRLLPLILITLVIEGLFILILNISFIFAILIAISLIWFIPFSSILYGLIYKNLTLTRSTS